mmetsp:Transcript_3646/g.7700  ORF Transcript_3646/g.7700 Transcript_3646/m.7700 type:complete len:133 (-) Transcript_3646:591-989(-)
MLFLYALFALLIVQMASPLAPQIQAARSLRMATNSNSLAPETPSTWVYRRSFVCTLTSVPLIALLPSASFAAPPMQGQGTPTATAENMEKSMLSTFSYPEPEPFVLRTQQLKFGGKAAKPMKGAGELGGTKK